MRRIVEDVFNRIRNGWIKWQKAIFCVVIRNTQLKVIEKFYKTIVKSQMTRLQ